MSTKLADYGYNALDVLKDVFHNAKEDHPDFQKMDYKVKAANATGRVMDSTLRVEKFNLGQKMATK